jgi:hypothetical protein
MDISEAVKASIAPRHQANVDGLRRRLGKPTVLRLVQFSQTLFAY